MWSFPGLPGRTELSSSPSWWTLFPAFSLDFISSPPLPDFFLLLFFSFNLPYFLPSGPHTPPLTFISSPSCWVLCPPHLTVHFLLPLSVSYSLLSPYFLSLSLNLISSPSHLTFLSSPILLYIVVSFPSPWTLIPPLLIGPHFLIFLLCCSFSPLTHISSSSHCTPNHLQALRWLWWVPFIPVKNTCFTQKHILKVELRHPGS